MEYRNLGNTGKKVSAIGLGCEHLDGKPYAQVEDAISCALDSGINILDVFMPGTEVRENIAKALGSNRKNVFIQGHIGSSNVGQQYDISRDMKTVKKYFEELLRIFGYIDFGMLFYIDSENDYKNVFETEFVSYAQKLKQNGDIHHIGFSSHNPETAIKAIKTGVPEIMMFSINPAFDLIPSEEYAAEHLKDGPELEWYRGLGPSRAELYKLCEEKQIGITAMKTLGSGKLISPEHTPFKKPLTIWQCIEYAITRPSVSSALLGCCSGAEIRDAMKYYDIAPEDRSFDEVINGIRSDFEGSCVYCSHCQPCPAEIDIAQVNKFLDIAKLDTQNIPPSIKSHYQSMTHNGGECIGCGGCESRCPFGVKVIENMAMAERLLAR